jgi:cytoskeletal protein CcmA (bactofilin family)
MEPGGDPMRSGGPLALVPAGGRFEGLVAFEGAARIDGDAEGEIQGRGSLVIGPTGRVRASVQVDELIVEGRLDGEVRARDRVSLGPGASVSATLITPRFSSADGALFEGRLDMPDPAGPPPSPRSA